MISIFFIACKGETPSNISTTAQAVASLTVSKILPGNYRPLNTSIPVLGSLSVTAKDLCSGQAINRHVLQLPKGNGLAFDRVAAETMSDGRKPPCGLKFVLNAALEPARNITPAHEFSIFISMAMPFLNKKWYLEGMARWMENGFKAPGENTRRLSPLPHCDSNFTRGYNAANYWASFAQAIFC